MANSWWLWTCVDLNPQSTVNPQSDIRNPAFEGLTPP
jgi:hypothetical protein